MTYPFCRSVWFAVRQVRDLSNNTHHLPPLCPVPKHFGRNHNGGMMMVLFDSQPTKCNATLGRHWGAACVECGGPTGHSLNPHFAVSETGKPP